MGSVLEYCLLGGHQVLQDGDEPWFDAIDVGLRLDDGSVKVFGLRTKRYLETVDPVDEEDWDGYTPLATTLDLSSVHHWDFGKVLWLGPTPNDCLAWSNASRVALRSMRATFPPKPSNALLDGPSGGGLPSPDAVGIVIPDDVVWHSIVTD